LSKSIDVPMGIHQPAEDEETKGSELPARAMGPFPINGLAIQAEAGPPIIIAPPGLLSAFFKKNLYWAHQPLRD
jgi:hypothetical protein